MTFGPSKKTKPRILVEPYQDQPKLMDRVNGKQGSQDFEQITPADLFREAAPVPDLT